MTTQDTKADWGAEIPVNGKRPGWLKGNDEVLLQECGLPFYKTSMLASEINWHSDLEAIRLPADHPHYAQPTLPDDLTARMVAENERLRKAIERALQCTPSIGSKYVGLAGMTYRQVIKYDCGDPWAILRGALVASEPESELIDNDLIEARKIAGDYWMSKGDHLGQRRSVNGEMDGSRDIDIALAAIKRGRALERGEGSHG